MNATKLGVAMALVAGLGMSGAAHAVPIVYKATLSGAAENPPVVSSGTGETTVTLDVDANTLRIEVAFSGLTGATTVAHIHCCTDAPANVGVAVTPGTLPGFPGGVASGAYDVTLDTEDLATYTGSFVTNFGGGTVAGAEAALAAGLAAGRAYLNIHTDFRAGGEIRGFLQVPEPATLALLGLGLAGLGYNRRGRS